MTVKIVIEILHIVAALALIGIVLLQADQGEGLAGAFGGGGSYAMFGKRGATGLMAQLTSGAAILFMVTSFALSYNLRPAPADLGAGGQTRAPLEGPNTGAPLANP